ncbi:MAG: bifunctional metallophosphatase/5'-nucleotidase [Armatimonadetes bacterium]|nr:bifunctional metallophosphatase/5'-nucleotidase [Armatimonadota bacterium]
MGPWAWRRWVGAVAAVLLLGGGSAVGEPTDALFTILHTNDLHGRLLPFTYAEAGRGGTERANAGGAANRAALIRRLRREIGNPTILVDAGDIFTRGALTNAHEGLADVAAMNACGYEVASVGNNEFKAKDAADQNDAVGSQAALLRVIRKSRFPWLCANLADSRGRPISGVRPYIVRRIGGLRVAFLGVTAPRSAGYPQTRGWVITDPIEAARTWVPRIRPTCDVLIALTHVGYALDQQLAKTVPGIDAIVGGDSHTFLYEPTWVEGPNGVRVPIVQAGEYGVNVGRFDLRFALDQGRARLTEATGRLVPVATEPTPNLAVERALKPYVRPFMETLGRLDRVGADRAEKARITTEVVVQALLKATGAEIALNPAGEGLIDVLQGPEVRRYDLYAAMPFRNMVVTALLSGAEVERLRAAHPTTVVAGMTASVPDRLYRVAFVDYVAEAAYGVSPVRIVASAGDVREAVESYLRSRMRSYRSTTAPGRSLIWTTRPSSISAAPVMTRARPASVALTR